VASALADVQGDQASRRAAAFVELCSSDRAFRPWYESALPRVYGFVYGRTGGDRALAEDITQQAFVSAVRSRRRFDGRSEAVVWVCSIARNALIDHYRRTGRDDRRRLKLVVRELAVAAEDQAWSRVDERERVTAALRAVAPDQRIAIVLRYLDGMSVREVAQRLRRSESSVESLLSRGRERLRVLLEDKV
jgi:RNA polymerase sigma-70 factor (ECF subfamily)